MVVKSRSTKRLSARLASALALWVLAALLCGCPRHAPPEAGARSPVTVTILSTNDLHGQLEPVKLLTAEPTPRNYRVGGAEALAATIAELRARDPEATVLLDAGDFLQGSLVSNTFEGKPVRQLFELLGYDAVTIGNHEFDFGPVGDRPLGRGADARGALKALMRRARFPVLAANIREENGRPVRWKNFRPSVVLTRRGIRIGIIGATTPEAAVTTMPSYVRGLRFDPLLGAVQREARALRSAGVGAVVLLVHAGGACRGREGASCRGELFEDLLARLEPGLVDAVVSGHTHQCIWHRYRGTPVVQACSRGLAVGRLTLTLDPSTGRVLESQAFPPTVTCHDTLGDAGHCEGRLPLGGTPSIVESPLLAKHRGIARRARDLVARYRARLDPGYRRVLASAARHLHHRRHGTSPLGTLFAEALLAAVPEADFALVNSGALRADLPAGEITLGQLFETFPFDNRVATVKVSADGLRRLIETMLHHSYGIVQVAGLRMKLDCGPPASLLALADRDGRPLEKRLYTVVLSDFLLAGGDGLGPVLSTIPEHLKRIYPDRLVRDEVARHLASQRQPVNSVDHPIVAPDDPPIVFAGSGCARAAAPARYLCR